MNEYIDSPLPPGLEFLECNAADDILLCKDSDFTKPLRCMGGLL